MMDFPQRWVLASVQAASRAVPMAWFSNSFTLLRGQIRNAAMLEAVCSDMHHPPAVKRQALCLAGAEVSSNGSSPQHD
jgi:hypothetical protein